MDTASKIASTGLCPADHRLFDEANGWFELGSLAEAWRAVNAISDDAQSRPAVLELRYHSRGSIASTLLDYNSASPPPFKASAQYSEFG